MPQSSQRKHIHKGRHKYSPAAKTSLLYGHHAIRAALLNPKRKLGRLFHSGALDTEISRLAITRNVICEPRSQDALAAMLHEGSLHQGICLEVTPLSEILLDDILPTWRGDSNVSVVMLDQVSDARNLGAILRSVYCLGADAVICTERHSAQENAHLAKAASGALEAVPIVRVGNLARGLEKLKAEGFWCYGFAGEASEPLHSVRWPQKTALVFGAEGQGLRRLSAENCDILLHIPQAHQSEDYGIDSLNLAQSVSIALYARNTKQNTMNP